MPPKKGSNAHSKSSTSSGKGYWKFFGCQYMVPCGEAFCNGCGHQPPVSVSCPSRQQPQSKGKVLPAKSFAERQVRAADAAGRAQTARDKDVAKKLASVQAELKKTIARAERAEADASKPPAPPAGAMEIDHDGTEAGASVLEAAISAARDELRQTQAFSDFQKSLVPD